MPNDMSQLSRWKLSLPEWWKLRLTVGLSRACNGTYCCYAAVPEQNNDSHQLDKAVMDREDALAAS